MHSVSTYPCPEEDLNLNIIKQLKRYKCKIVILGMKYLLVHLAVVALGVSCRTTCYTQ